MNPNDPPDGGKMRRQWEAIGMSRASWYRHGKPAEKPEAKITQREMAQALNVSIRTIQRYAAERNQERREQIHKEAARLRAEGCPENELVQRVSESLNAATSRNPETLTPRQYLDLIRIRLGTVIS